MSYFITNYSHVRSNHIVKKCVSVLTYLVIVIWYTAIVFYADMQDEINNEPSGLTFIVEQSLSDEINMLVITFKNLILKIYCCVYCVQNIVLQHNNIHFKTNEITIFRPLLYHSAKNYLILLTRINFKLSYN